MKQPRPYQLAGIARAQQDHLLLRDECGLGKTLTAVETAKALFGSAPGPALIICPKRLIGQWCETIAEQDEDRPVVVVTASHTFAGPLTSKRSYWIVIHYEALIKHVDMLRKTMYSAIIVDEAHKIRNRKNISTKAIKRLNCYRKIALTGTAFDRDPSDLWSLVNWLYPVEFASYWKFYEQYVEYDNFGNWRVVRGVKDPKAFAALLARMSMRRTKADVAPELPAKIIQHVNLDMLPDQAALYQRIIDREVWVKVTDDTELKIGNVLAEITRCLQCAIDPSLIGSPAPSAKIAWIDDWIEDNPDQSVIVFTRYRDTAITLANRLQADCTIVGGAKPYGDPKTAKRIVGTIAAMGEGLDLPHISTAIFLDSDWSSILMKQAIDRIDRLGITESKHIIYVHALDTVDGLVRGLLEHKYTMAQLVEQFVSQVDGSG